MNMLDFFIGVFLIIGLVKGFRNGFFVELASLVSILLGIFIAIKSKNDSDRRVCIDFSACHYWRFDAGADFYVDCEFCFSRSSEFNFWWIIRVAAVGSGVEHLVEFIPETQ